VLGWQRQDLKLAAVLLDELGLEVVIKASVCVSLTCICTCPCQGKHVYVCVRMLFKTSSIYRRPSVCVCARALCICLISRHTVHHHPVSPLHLLVKVWGQAVLYTFPRSNCCAFSQTSTADLFFNQQTNNALHCASEAAGRFLLLYKLPLILQATFCGPLHAGQC